MVPDAKYRKALDFIAEAKAEIDRLKNVLQEARDQFVFYDENVTIKNHDKELIERMNSLLATEAATPAEPDGRCWVCGRRQPFLWHAHDDIWAAVNGSTDGVLCPDCFDRRALGSGYRLVWTCRGIAEVD